MKPSTKRVLKVLHILSWIVFTGICVKAGALIISFFVSLFVNPEGAKNLHLGLNLANLYQYDKTQYAIIVTIIILLTVLKAYIMYQVIRIFLRINLTHPFSEEVSVLIARISYLALGIGTFTVMANAYCDWLEKKGVIFPNLQYYLGAAGEFLLLGGIIFVIAQVFKKGIEIQTENELTV